jgi:hypothetical protein
MSMLGDRACGDAFAGELLELRDISVEESEDLPRILGPLAEDAAASALGRAAALDQAPLDRELLLAAIEAAAPAVAKLRVRSAPQLFPHVFPADPPRAAVLPDRDPMATNISRCLQTVLFIMGARLAEINSKWDDGSLQRVGLTAEEVMHLVGIPRLALAIAHSCPLLAVSSPAENVKWQAAAIIDLSDALS